MTHSYIQKVKMSGYKSIKDLECELQPGLNIIIGKNGSGKTNFLEMMDKCLDKNADINNPFKFQIQYFNDKEVLNWRIVGERRKSENDIFMPSIERIENGVKYLTNHTLIKYKIPLDLPLLDDFINLKADYQSKEIIFDENISKEVSSFLFANIFTSFSLKIKQSFKVNGNIDFDYSPEFIDDFNNGFENTKHSFVQYLKSNSPIKNIRISNKLNVKIINDVIQVNNIIYEFFVNGDWFQWKDLSDGTKRILYIFDCILLDNIVQRVMKKTENFNNPILIEEPELGIHPHQLHLLMQFLKEQAKERQIIITTHSPQVLDILEKDELKNILIAEMKENGTQIRNMTDEEMSDAKTYMDDEDLLSAYWRFTDFNRV